MKKITETTHYTLFKPTHPTSIIYYIRIEIEGKDHIVWHTGYENSGGRISFVGSELPLNQQDMLEREYQYKIKKEQN